MMGKGLLWLFRCLGLTVEEAQGSRFILSFVCGLHIFQDLAFQGLLDITTGLVSDEMDLCTQV